MTIERNQTVDSGHPRSNCVLRRAIRIRQCAMALAVVALLSGTVSTSQRSQYPILNPLANPTPDANQQNAINERHQRQQNFDAANALRKQQIEDDSTKLLILTRDLKAQMDKLGDNPVPERLQREAAVIELLARDVQTRMVLTVHGG